MRLDGPFPTLYNSRKLSIMLPHPLSLLINYHFLLNIINLTQFLIQA